jgi:hypothetical protein
MTAAALAGSLTVACATPTHSDSRSCQQTYEFGNYGCFEITGHVVGLHGQALSGISVRAHAIAENVAINTGIPATATDGSFTLRGVLFADPRPDRPDTISVRLVAVDPNSATLTTPASIRDSVTALVTITPIGSIPTPIRVDMTLGVP